MKLVVFDSGIGSWSIIRKLRKLPLDIVYVADRLNFPYGAKTSEELYKIMTDSIDIFVQYYRPDAILLASNTPSVLLLDRLKKEYDIPLYGVFPPIDRAFELSRTGHIGVLATSLTARTLPQTDHCQPFAADVLVALVESGAFLTQPAWTAKTIKEYMDPIITHHPKTDVYTLSSTHLPFLQPFFEKLYPTIQFVDPADEIVRVFRPLATGRRRSLRIVATAEHKEFAGICRRLGIREPVHTPPWRSAVKS